MANKFTYQVLRDTTTDAVIKLTGQFDGVSGQESNSARIQANTLNGALATNQFLRANVQGGAANTALPFYNLQVTNVQYYCSLPSSAAVELFWAGNGAANNATIFYMNLNGEYGSQQQPTLLNNAIGGFGDLGVNTYGATANSAYTLIISLRKDNNMYQRGQFNDPAAFNYGVYGPKP